MGRFVLSGLMILVALTTVTADVSSFGRTKRLILDDLFHLERLGDAVISPDGNWIAYVVKRPIEPATHVRTLHFGDERADIWLVSTKGGKPVNLTKGATDKTGFWNPIWSPDSQRIAMLSTRGGDDTLWVIERSTGRLGQITASAVELWSTSSVLWISNHVVACSVLPKGKARIRTAEVAMRAWSKAWTGLQVTASILDSGMPSAFESRPAGRLIFVDVQTGSSKAADGDFLDLRVSPDQKYLAALETVGVVRPKADMPLTVPSQDNQLAVFSTDGERLPVSRVPANFLESIHWAPDGKNLALMGRNADGLQIYRYRIGTQTPELITGNDVVARETWWDPTGILWSANGDLVIRAEAKSSSRSGGTKRFDWWFLSKRDQARNLSVTMKSPPLRLVPEADGSFIGLSEGKLWQVFTNGLPPVAIALDSQQKMTLLVWPFGELQQNSFTQIIAGSTNPEVASLYRIDLRSRKVELIEKPTAEATLTCYDSETGQAVFMADTSEGTLLWLKTDDSPTRTIVETNTFLGRIGEGETRKIDYLGLDGQALKAWLVLPPGYQRGRRYPMVTYVYAGSIAGDRPSLLTRIYSEAFINLQLLSAQGYIVLMPSMPLKQYGVASDPYMELTKGVLPAVDRAIDLGYADPERLGLMGHSYGGYTTYGLVTQTNRFKSAVCLAGLSDLISLYGTFEAESRYEPNAHENPIYGREQAESAQIRMGNPPWKDLGRYLRNSPLFYVDRVQTPLLILQGDMDAVAIQQGEEFFTALYRQGKRARFIRYWGERHIFSSPANIRDFWSQTLAWLDEFCDISRDVSGKLVFDGESVRSRKGAPPLRAEDFVRFDETELRSHSWVQRQPTTDNH